MNVKTVLLALFLPAAQEDPVPRLVERLGDSDPGVREAATAELRRIGARAVPALEKAAEDPDAEVRVRAREIVRPFLKWREAGAGARAALAWLARHQAEDGSWPGVRKDGCCPSTANSEFGVGLTGLSLLAFVRGGLPPASREAREGIPRAAAWIVRRQELGGMIGPGDGVKPLYGHALCTLALAELQAASPSEALKGPLRHAVEFLVAAQNPGKGWRYQSRSGDNDTSVTFWCAWALLAARRAGLEVPEAAFRGAKIWLAEVTEEGYGRVGYTQRSTGRTSLPGLNEQFDHHESLTALGHWLWIALGTSRQEERTASAMQLLLRDVPKWEGNNNDFYYWFAGTLALREQQGPDGAGWKRWEEAARLSLLAHQWGKYDGCLSGSWDPVDRWGSEGGRVYATALNALTLGICAGRAEASKP